MYVCIHVLLHGLGGRICVYIIYIYNIYPPPPIPAVSYAPLLTQRDSYIFGFYPCILKMLLVFIFKNVRHYL